MKNKDSFKVGIISTVLIFLIGLLLLWKSNLLLRTTGYEVRGHFTNISGLLAGAEVRYRGYKVGRVVSIDPQPHYVIARFFVKEGTDIPKDSELKVDFDGLIGEKFIQIMPNVESAIMIEPGSILTGYANAGISDFVEIGAQNLKETKAILSSLRRVVASDDVSNAMTNAFLSLEKITDNLEEITKVVGSGDFQNILSDIDSIISSLRSASDTIFVDGTFATDLTNFAKNLNTLSSRLEEQHIIDKIDKTVSNLAGFSEAINVKDRFDFNTSTDFLYRSVEESGFYNANFDISYSNKFLRFGFGNQLGKNELLNIQHGIKVNPYFTTRIGLFYNEPGFSLDYELWETVGFSIEAFNFTNPEYMVTNTYRIGEELHVLLRLLNNPNTGQFDNFGFGFRLTP